MAKGVNFFFWGRLGKDPELKYVGKDQRPCVNFTVAINMGEKAGTEWINCVAWGDNAVEIAENYSKGDKIYIKESSPCTNRWEHLGKKYEKLQFLVWSFHSKPSEGEGSTAGPGRSGTRDNLPDDDPPY